jgi:nucleoside-diphosphate-sugar epimerase
LVTGASGYISTHIVQQLLDAGYLVRGTVRSLANESKINPLKDLNHANERLELVEADLLDSPDAWKKYAFSWYDKLLFKFRVVKGCDYVLHVASPFPLVDDESTVQIAVDGTLNVLKACAKCASVKKVVLTSSCA